MTKLKPVSLSDIALKVLQKRYLVKDGQGRVVETPEELFWRVATCVAASEKNHGLSEDDVKALADTFYDLMVTRDFMPNSPTLMNAGRPLGQLSACFVLPVPDSIDGIFETIKHTALIQKSGGGTGFSFSRLRPNGDQVKSTTGVSSGPVSFMEAFNAATETIKQGSTRRGANMGILRVDHPDISDFIRCKDDTSKITNFNISVAVTEKFMEAVEKDEEYDLVNPRDGQVVRRERAREVFEAIYKHAWKTGEPGIVFIDRINNTNPIPSQEIEATNPCGEQPLGPYESCNLGSLNLAHMVKEVGGEARVDWDKLKERVHLAVRFLDDIIEANNYPLPEIDEATKANRRIGLGVMGWADLLIELGIPYNSEDAVNLAEEMMAFINREGHLASRELAKVRGSFPNFEISRFPGKGYSEMRNSTVTTIAPTGTISMIAGCSGGIEPLFAISFVRNQAGMEMVDVNPVFERIAKTRGFYSEELMKKIAEQGTVAHLDEIPEDVRRVWVCSHDIAPEWHVRMQAAFQQHTDNAVSKTINLPRDASPDDVRATYEFAYKLGCKGITVYRDGSREEQVLNIGKVNKDKQEAQAPQVSLAPAPQVRTRPQILSGLTYRWQVGDEHIYVTVNKDELGIREVFINAGKSGSDVYSLCEALGMLISGMLKEGLGTSFIKKQLRGIKSNPTFNPGGLVHSIPDAVAISIAMAEQDARDFAAYKGKRAISGPTCPDCDGALHMAEGCMRCGGCGYSKCS